MTGFGGQLRQQGLHLGLTEPTVPAGGADRTDPAGGRPPGDGLGVDPEQGRDFARGEQPLAHVPHRGGHIRLLEIFAEISGEPVASWHLDHRVLERLCDGKEVVRGKTPTKDSRCGARRLPAWTTWTVASSPSSG